MSDSPESDSSELIIVDDTEESAFRNQILDENKDSVLHCVPFVPKEDTNMEDEKTKLHLFTNRIAHIRSRVWRGSKRVGLQGQHGHARRRA